ncbi:TadE/TadG family type IV pilus assembly protein [Moorella sulfitireducens]|uniref:TadE/TadG family type IV pilus assembly protein n=1 Tax=Neomoorella sulfitireducens TaxID=2972948 RepID=UPI0021AC1510|nr:TadE/TadG family type IV pilus assembly protein [Moorella sulfitireducens]
MLWGKIFGSRRAQALVELALILPLLLLIVMGSLDTGRILHSYLVLSSAGREGARVGSVGGDDAEIRERVMEVAPTLNLTESDISVIPEQGLRNPGTPLTVKVTCRIEFITPFLDGLLPSPFPLTAVTTMRVE